MRCYHPLRAYRSREVNPKTGKRQIVFNVKDGYYDLPVSLPCGQCWGCRLERSRQWAVRCIHEASLHEDNCFITLTFNNEHLEENGSLVKSDFQKFMKRLRKKVDVTVRYFHCGEYGDKLKRPHHHACLFGYDFPDRELFSLRNGLPLYRSELLESLWPFGWCTVGDVTWESAAYVARYIMKKITGKESEGYYGELLPPYTTMSRRPGIGHGWFEQYKSDVYPDDKVIVRNDIKCMPPRYYDNLYDVLDPDAFEAIKKKRLQGANSQKAKDEDTDKRRAARELFKRRQTKELKRGLHEE